MKKRQVPHPVTHFFCTLLTFVLILLLLGTLCTYYLNKITHDPAIPLEVALSDKTIAAQKQRIYDRINTMADDIPFTPECITSLVTDDALRQYNRDIITWWQGLANPEEMTAPDFATQQEIESAVTSDPLFSQSIEKNLQKSVSRDRVAVPVLNAIKETVLPVRSSLITIGFSIVGKRIDIAHYTAFLPWLAWIFALSALVIVSLILLLTSRRICCGFMYLGAALSSCGLMVLLCLLFAMLKNPAAALSALSPIAALQLEQLFSILSHQIIIVSVVAIVTGFILIGIHQFQMKHVLREVRL